MAIDVLGHAVDLKIRPVLDGIDADGTGKGSVHTHDRACRMGDLRNRVQVTDSRGRVARRFHMDEFGVGANCSTDSLSVGGVQQGHFNVVFLRQIFTEQEIGCTVADLGYDRMISTVEEGRKHCGECCNPAGKDRTVFCAGQGTKFILKDHLVDVAVALVDVAVRSAPVHWCAVGGDAIIGGHVDRFVDRAESIVLAGAAVDCCCDGMKVFVHKSFLPFLISDSIIAHQGQ